MSGTLSTLERPVDLSDLPVLVDFDSPPPKPIKRHGVSPSKSLLLVALFLTAVTRVAYLASNRVLFSADEATTGLMVRQILHGQFYAFYAGQNYGGTIEQYLEALTYLIFRLPQDPFTLRLPLVALSVLTCYLVYLFGKRMLGPSRAVIAALLFAIVPWFNIVGTTTSLGFYVVGQMLGIFTLYLALRVGDSNGTNSKWNLVFGISCGLAIWTSLTCVAEVVPALLWVAPLVSRKPRGALWGALGIAVGGAPQWICSIASGHLPLPGAPDRSSGVAGRLGNLFGSVGREYLGLTYNYARGGAPIGIQVLIEVTALGALAYAFSRRSKGILSMLTFRRRDRRPADMLLLIFVMVVLSYALSSSTWFVGQPRYILSTYPAFVLGVASIVPTRMTKVSATILSVALGFWLVVTAGYFVDAHVVPTTVSRDKTFQQVAAVLIKDHETYVYAGYWTAMPLQYVAGSSLHVAVCEGAERFAQTQTSVERRRDPVYIASTLDGTERQIKITLRIHHIRYLERTIRFVHIYYHLDPPVSPTTLGL